MPTVVDAARITARGAAVWRTCSGCGLLSPTTDRCLGCRRPVTDVVTDHRVTGWDFANLYATLLGRIDAWAGLIPDVSDAERLCGIREVLKALDDSHPRWREAR